MAPRSTSYICSQIIRNILPGLIHATKLRGQLSRVADDAVIMHFGYISRDFRVQLFLSAEHLHFFNFAQFNGEECQIGICKTKVWLRNFLLSIFLSETSFDSEKKSGCIFVATIYRVLKVSSALLLTSFL